MKYKLLQQKKIEEASVRQQQREEEWYERKFDLGKQLKESRAERNKEKSSSSSPQTVKLQKYTITSWLRFWNQFSTQLDGPRIAEISKFNYLQGLAKGKPREDFMGLPHTMDGYRNMYDRGRGRPKKSWKKYVQEDLKCIGVDEEEAMNRISWRTVIKCLTS